MIARVTIVKPARVQVQPNAAKPAVIQVGITGPQGPAYQTYQHTQAVPASVWVINHNLGIRPDIALIDAGGAEIEGAVLHLSTNQARVTFAIAVAGTARCS